MSHKSFSVIQNSDLHTLVYSTKGLTHHCKIWHSISCCWTYKHYHMCWNNMFLWTGPHWYCSRLFLWLFHWEIFKVFRYKIYSLHIDFWQGPVTIHGAVILFFVTSQSWLQADLPSNKDWGHEHWISFHFISLRYIKRQYVSRGGLSSTVIKFKKIIAYKEVSGSWWQVAMKENM